MNQDDVKNYQSLIAYVARKYANRGVPFEDLVQEGLFGLLEAEKRFDPTRGVKFSTYAVHWIHKRIGEIVKEEEKTSLKALRLDEAHDIGQEDPAFEEEMIAYDRLPDIELPLRLPEPERVIVGLLFGEGKTLVEISRIAGLSRERVRQLKQKALRRMKIHHKVTHSLSFNHR